MVITTKSALRIIRQRDERGRPVPFLVGFYTCDEERGTGGDYIEMANCVVAGQKAQAQALNDAVPAPSKAKNRRPASDLKQTILVYCIDSKQTRRVYIWLIYKLNSFDVLY